MATMCPPPAYEEAQTLYIHPIWIWDAVSRGLQPQSWHNNVIWAPPYPNRPKFGPHFHGYNSVRVHPYAHPQHMKVLKHLIYIQYGCGKQSAGVYSLHHDTTTSFGIRLTPIFQNLAPTLHRYNSVRVHPYAHPQHMNMKVLNTLLIIQIGMWEAVSGGLEPQQQQCHHAIIS